MAGAPEWLTAQAYAHRGLHDASVPENSLAAFRAAMARGLGIECDIRISSDGRAVVFHDAETVRLTGQDGVTQAMGVAQLTTLHLLAGDGRESGEQVPTLRDMLDEVAGKVPLLLELKTDGNEPVQTLCRAVRRDVEGYPGPLAVMSFDPRIGAWFASHVPDLPRGIVITEQGSRTLSGAVRRRLTAKRALPHFLAYDIRDLPSRFAQSYAKCGTPVLSWTVTRAEHVATAERAGAIPILEGAGVAAWESRA